MLCEKYPYLETKEENNQLLSERDENHLEVYKRKKIYRKLSMEFESDSLDATDETCSIAEKNENIWDKSDESGEEDENMRDEEVSSHILCNALKRKSQVLPAFEPKRFKSRELDVNNLWDIDFLLNQSYRKLKLNKRSPLRISLLISNLAKELEKQLNVLRLSQATSDHSDVRQMSELDDSSTLGGTGCLRPVVDSCLSWEMPTNCYGNMNLAVPVQNDSELCVPPLNGEYMDISQNTPQAFSLISPFSHDSNDVRMELGQAKVYYDLNSSRNYVFTEHAASTSGSQYNNDLEYFREEFGFNTDSNMPSFVCHDNHLYRQLPVEQEECVEEVTWNGDYDIGNNVYTTVDEGQNLSMTTCCCLNEDSSETKLYKFIECQTLKHSNCFISKSITSNA